MPNLTQCMPLSYIASNFESKIGSESKDLIERMQKIRKVLEDALNVFGAKILDDKVLIKYVQDEEDRIIQELYKTNEFIPKPCAIPIEDEYIKKYGQKNWRTRKFDASFIERKLSYYPVTDVMEVISIADKMDMVILPLDYVDLPALLKAHNINIPDNRYWGISKQYEFYNSIYDCVNYLKEIKYQSSQMYILCPLSYYNVWEEIKSKDLLPKYNPVSLDAIFTTIDLMIPAQRNLYNMSKTNEENIKGLTKGLKENVDLINSKLKNLESRMSKVEAQIAEILEQQKMQQQQINAQAAVIQEQQTQIESLTYRLIDPVIFFVNGEPIDFLNKAHHKRKAHIVACFGPEFPTEFFVKNDMQVYHDKASGLNISIPDATFRIPLL